MGRGGVRRRRGGRSLVTAEGSRGGIIGDSDAVVAEDGRRYAFADHNCFACGRNNPIGMRLRIEIGDGIARTSWRADENHVGWSDKLHGGLIATMLDEVMAWAPSSFDSWAVTAEMSVRYRSPASPGEELTAVGRVVDRRRRIYDVEGEVRGQDGRVVSEGRGRYLGASPAEKDDLKARYGVETGVGGE